MPAKVRTLRESQSNWTALRRTQEEAARKYLEKKPVGYAMRADHLATFRYAYRNRPDLLGRVAEISDGTGQANLIQDINDLAVLGRHNPDPLTAIGFDLAKLEEAAELSEELSELGAIRDANIAADPVKETRDRAFTNLKPDVDEIRACGRFVFRKNPKRLAQYGSAYARRVRSSGNGGKNGTATVDENGKGQPAGNEQVTANGQVQVTVA